MLFVQTNPLKQDHIIDMCLSRLSMAYQFAVYMKNLSKNKSCIRGIAWHGILYFSKIIEEPRRI
jgi:hypothetical protein